MKKKNVIVIQEETSDCGVSCLLSIIRYYNGDASLENMRITSRTSSKGVTAYNLIECAKHYGFDCLGLKTDNLKNIHLPYIAHLNINNTLSHFVVVYEVTDKSVQIMDPAYGMKWISIDVFLKQFDGVIISLFPKNKILKEHISNTLSKNILLEIKKSKIFIVLMIILNLILVFLSIIYSNYINILNDSVSSLIIFIILIIVMKLIIYLKESINMKVLNKAGKNIKKHFYDHIFNLPLRILHLKDSSEIIKRINELDEVKDVFYNLIISSILTFIYIVSILISITFMNIYITFIILITFLILIFIIKHFYKKLQYYINDYIYSSTDYSKTLQNDISAIESIKHLKQEEIFKDNLEEKYEKNLDNELIIRKKINEIELIKNIYLSIVEIIVIFIMIKNNSSINEIFIIQMLISFLLSSFNEFLNVIPTFTLEKKVIRKINEFYNIKVSNEGVNKFKNGTIRFDKVSFSYNDYSNVLNDISFEINENDKVMINGISGSGKSTLMRLLNRDYDTYKGCISINGEDIRNIDINDYKDNVLYLSQDEKFINGTIKDNILFGRKISDEEFLKIESICKLDVVIEKYPIKYETYICNDHNSLSGGEKSLIILARALVSPKSILIIDEVLSELSIDLEIEVLNNLKKYVNSTIIYISHKKTNVFDNLIDVRKE